MSTKTFGIFDVAIRITQKWRAIAHENRQNELMLASEIVWPSKWVGKVVMDNCMHRQGLNGCLQKNLAFLTSESGSPKKWCAIPHENRRNEAYARFGARLTLQMGRTSRDVQTYALTRSWGTSTKKFTIFDVGIRITKKMMCYSTRKSLKWGVCSLRARLTLQMGRTRRDGQPYA